MDDPLGGAANSGLQLLEEDFSWLTEQVGAPFCHVEGAALFTFAPCLDVPKVGKRRLPIFVLHPLASGA